MDQTTPSVPIRWYTTPFGRVLRALLGVPFLALAVHLFQTAGAMAKIGSLLCLYLGLSLPWAAVVQEPD